MLMYGHSRNQTGITLVSKALKEQENSCIYQLFKGEKTNRGSSAGFFFSSHKQHSLKRTKIRVSLIPVVNC